MRVNRRAVVLGVFALFLGSLVLSSVAEARAGGSRSSGSRGSRSYSAPQTPSSPATPASPARTAPGQPAPQRGGFLGGLGGMMGGLLLGGLIGSLLFGGLGHGLFGGIGLMEILLFGGLLYLAFAMFRRRQPAPAVASGPSARMGWTPAEAPTAQGTAAGTAVAPAGTDLEGGLAAIRSMDRGFDPMRFADGVARDAFLGIQAAWTARNLGGIRPLVTDEVATGFEGDLARLRERGHLNRVEGVVVDLAQVTEAWQELGRDYVTVRLAARALDYTLDERTGGMLDGSRTALTSFEEFWTFVRPVGPNAWRLSAIQQPVA